MRSITKRAEPRAFRDWKAQMQSSPQNLTYDNLPTGEKDAIKASLLEEQGNLCAYTMRRLQRVDDCHIEHVQPQKAAPGLDLDYANMAACFPAAGGDTSCGYGAPIKGGSPVVLNVTFVSPHSQGCEQRFIYTADGGVQAQNGDAAAAATVDLLKLGERKLAELRRAAIEAHGLTLRTQWARKRHSLKSAAQARRFANEVLQPDAMGRLEPFCVALAQVALRYAEKEEARAQRQRAEH